MATARLIPPSKTYGPYDQHFHPRLNQTRDTLDRQRKNPVGPSLQKERYYLFDEDTLKVNKTRIQAFTGIVEGTQLNQLFMSQANINLLQTRLRYEVWKLSNGRYKIGKQDETELLLIMRSIYLQYSSNQPTHIKEQIDELNKIVIRECVPRILSGIEQYLGYIRDASANYVPNDLPQNVSSAGRKTLRSVTSTF